MPANEKLEKVSSIWLLRKRMPSRSAPPIAAREVEKCPKDSRNDDAVRIPMFARRTSKFPVARS